MNLLQNQKQFAPKSTGLFWIYFFKRDGINREPWFAPIECRCSIWLYRSLSRLSLSIFWSSFDLTLQKYCSSGWLIWYLGWSILCLRQPSTFVSQAWRLISFLLSLASFFSPSCFKFIICDFDITNGIFNTISDLWWFVSVVLKTMGSLYIATIEYTCNDCNWLTIFGMACDTCRMWSLNYFFNQWFISLHQNWWQINVAAYICQRRLKKQRNRVINYDVYIRRWIKGNMSCPVARSQQKRDQTGQKAGHKNNVFLRLKIKLLTVQFPHRNYCGHSWL